MATSFNYAKKSTITDQNQKQCIVAARLDPCPIFASFCITQVLQFQDIAYEISARIRIIFHVPFFSDVLYSYISEQSPLFLRPGWLRGAAQCVVLLLCWMLLIRVELFTIIRSSSSASKIDLYFPALPHNNTHDWMICSVSGLWTVGFLINAT